MQHVLIFDDHPESLRLVFGGAAAQVDLSRLPGASSRHLVLLSILIMGLLTHFVVVLLTIPRLSSWAGATGGPHPKEATSITQTLHRKIPPTRNSREKDSHDHKI